MQIEVTEDYGILLKEVFNGVMFETKEGEKLGVCMRDGVLKFLSYHQESPMILLLMSMLLKMEKLKD